MDQAARQRRRVRAREIEREDASPVPDPKIDALLALQRSAGNAAVAKLARRILVQGTERNDADPPGPDTPPHRNLYAALRASARDFHFGSEDDLADFLENKKGMAQTPHDAATLLAGAGQPETTPISDVATENTAVSHTTLRKKLRIQLDGMPDLEANAYSSMKRHLLETPPRPQFNEPGASPNNTYAKVSQARYQQAFENYVEVHAQTLRRRKMLFGYDPAREPGHDGDVIFGAQPSAWPRQDNDGLLNPIHAYPVRGTRVRRLGQSQYAAVVRIRAWFHHVDLDTDRRQPTANYPTLGDLTPTQVGTITELGNLWNPFQLAYGAHMPAASAVALAGNLPQFTGASGRTPMLVTFKKPFQILHDLQVARGALSATAPAIDTTAITPGTRDVVSFLRNEGVTRESIAWFIDDVDSAALDRLFALVAGHGQPNQINTAIQGAAAAPVQLESRRALLDRALRDSRVSREPASVTAAIAALDAFAKALRGAGFLTHGEWEMLT
jgi:hypothetical protein